MIIYQDIITGDELFSDAFPIKEVGGVYEIDCAMITIKEGDVDIGANASAEEAEEALEDGAVVVNNVIHSFRLQSTSFDKKGYTVYIKGYLKALKAAKNLTVEEEIKAFESEMTTEVKKILGGFKDYEFYTGESMNPEGAIMLLNYREDGTTPYFTVFKHAVKTMKVVDILDGTTPVIAIIGAGFSGICAGIRLKTQLNLESYRIFELEPDIGGTWWSNSYPGCACDVAAHNYSLTFEPNYNWSRRYPAQQEIWEYMRKTARKHNLYEKISFRTEVTHIEWKQGRQKWVLDFVNLNTGEVDKMEADFVFSGMGPLRIPKIPKEFENFEGPKWHSAQWNHSYDLTNKRVAIVGSGASAIQIVPSIVNKVKTLEYYQRTASYIIPRRNKPYSALWKWMFRYIPLFHRIYTQYLFWSMEVLILAFSSKHRDKIPRAATALLAWAIRFVQVRDKTLRKKLTPTYEMGCKRIVVSSDYFPALVKKNVHVHTEAIKSIKGNTLTLEDGSVQEVDVLVLATGFQTQDLLPKGFLIGKGGCDVSEWWGKTPVTYYGMTTPVTPNFFFLLGPNTTLGHNSVLHMIEAQVEYAIKVLSFMMKKDLVSVQVTQEACKEFMDEIDEKMEGMVWSQGCKSWYQNEEGKVTALWWGSVVAYRQRLRKFHPERFKESDFRFWVVDMAELGDADEKYETEEHTRVSQLVNLRGQLIVEDR
ncbi:hypothetical protein BGZ79_003484 [Entomortierella chlamydospora]|nr:hypothetical protein BGZ79_003484 [Entomortierella chlamydospora]